jgi:hypothetical protein
MMSAVVKSIYILTLGRAFVEWRWWWLGGRGERGHGDDGEVLLVPLLLLKTKGRWHSSRDELERVLTWAVGYAAKLCQEYGIEVNSKEKAWNQIYVVSDGVAVVAVQCIAGFLCRERVKKSE